MFSICSKFDTYLLNDETFRGYCFLMAQMILPVLESETPLQLFNKISLFNFDEKILMDEFKINVLSLMKKNLDILRPLDLNRQTKFYSTVSSANNTISAVDYIEAVEIVLRLNTQKNFYHTNKQGYNVKFLGWLNFDRPVKSTIKIFNKISCSKTTKPLIIYLGFILAIQIQVQVMLGDTMEKIEKNINQSLDYGIKTGIFNRLIDQLDLYTIALLKRSKHLINNYTSKNQIVYNHGIQNNISTVKADYVIMNKLINQTTYVINKLYLKKNYYDFCSYVKNLLSQKPEQDISEKILNFLYNDTSNLFFENSKGDKINFRKTIKDLINIKRKINLQNNISSNDGQYRNDQEQNNLLQQNLLGSKGNKIFQKSNTSNYRIQNSFPDNIEENLLQKSGQYDFSGVEDCVIEYFEKNQMNQNIYGKYKNICLQIFRCLYQDLRILYDLNALEFKIRFGFKKYSERLKNYCIVTAFNSQLNKVLFCYNQIDKSLNDFYLTKITEKEQPLLKNKLLQFLLKKKEVIANIAQQLHTSHILNKKNSMKQPYSVLNNDSGSFLNYNNSDNCNHKVDVVKDSQNSTLLKLPNDKVIKYVEQSKFTVKNICTPDLKKMAFIERKKMLQHDLLFVLKE